MGQLQFRSQSAKEKQTKKKKKVLLRPRKSDNDYVLAISNPAFLDWEHRVEKEQRMKAEIKQATIEKLEAQHQEFPFPISEQVLISNANGASNIEKLKTLGVTHVLNVGGNSAAWIPREAYEEAGLNYRIVVDALDEPSYPMLDHHLDECREFIEDACHQDGKCVVHCQAGCNRSGVIVAANYMLTTRTNVLETVLHCRKVRGNAFLTNPGFQGQLVALARQQGLLGPAPGQPKCVVDRFLWHKVTENR